MEVPGPDTRMFLYPFGRNRKTQESLLDSLAVGMAVQELLEEFYSSKICSVSALQGIKHTELHIGITW